MRNVKEILFCVQENMKKRTPSFELQIKGEKRIVFNQKNQPQETKQKKKVLTWVLHPDQTPLRYANVLLDHSNQALVTQYDQTY